MVADVYNAKIDNVSQFQIMNIK